MQRGWAGEWNRYSMRSKHHGIIETCIVYLFIDAGGEGNKHR